jgi:hypothetical protein
LRKSSDPVLIGIFVVTAIVLGAVGALLASVAWAGGEAEGRWAAAPALLIGVAGVLACVAVWRAVQRLMYGRGRLAARAHAEFLRVDQIIGAAERLDALLLALDVAVEPVVGGFCLCRGGAGGEGALAALADGFVRSKAAGRGLPLLEISMLGEALSSIPETGIFISVQRWEVLRGGRKGVLFDLPGLFDAVVRAAEIIERPADSFEEEIYLWLAQVSAVRRDLELPPEASVRRATLFGPAGDRDGMADRILRTVELRYGVALSRDEALRVGAFGHLVCHIAQQAENRRFAGALADPPLNLTAG